MTKCPYMTSQNNDIEIMELIKSCHANSFLIENEQGLINSYGNLFSMPTVGYHAGKLVKTEIELIEPLKVRVDKNGKTFHSIYVPIELLYPSKNSIKARIYYAYGKKGKKQVLVSNWFDVLPLPQEYRKYVK